MSIVTSAQDHSKNRRTRRRKSTANWTSSRTEISCQMTSSWENSSQRGKQRKIMQWRNVHVIAHTFYSYQLLCHPFLFLLTGLFFSFLSFLFSLLQGVRQCPQGYMAKGERCKNDSTARLAALTILCAVLQDKETHSVVIKKLHPDIKEEDRIPFLQEAIVMGQFQHPNITRLHGVVTKDVPVSSQCLAMYNFMSIASSKNCFFSMSVIDISSLLMWAIVAQTYMQRTLAPLQKKLRVHHWPLL